MKSKQILIAILIVVIAFFLWTNFVAKNPVSSNQIKQEINYSDFNVTKTITFLGNERTEEYSFDLRNPVVSYLLLPKELVSNASNVKISGDFSRQIVDEDPLIKLIPTEYGPGTKKVTLKFTDTNKQLTSILFALPYVSFNELTTDQKTVLENGIKDLQTNSSIDNYTIDHSKIVMQQFANNQKKAGLQEETYSTKLSFAQPIAPQQILTSISQILKKKDQQTATTIIPTNSKQKLFANGFIQTTLTSMNTPMVQKNPATSPNNYTMTIKFSAQKKDFPEDINFFVSEESLTDSETLFVENSSAPEFSVEGGLKEYFSVGAVQIDDQLYGIYIDLNIPQEVFDEMSMFDTLEQKVKVKLDLFNEKTVTVHLRKDFCLKRVNDAAKQIDLNEEQKHSIELSCYNEYFEGKKENLSSTLQAIELSKAKVFFTQSEIDSIGSDPNDYPESTNSLEPVYRMEVLGLKVSGEAAQLEVLRKMRQNTVNTQNCEAYLPKDYLTNQTKPQTPASISDFSLINPEIRSYIPVQGRVLDEKAVMDRVNATSKSQLNDYFNAEIKKIKDENNSYFLTNGIEQYLQEYSFWQCIYEKELANSQEYFAKAKDRLAGFKKDSDLDTIQSILENKLLISENEIDYANSKGELDLLSVQLQATASDKLLNDNWQVLCPYAQDKYECERKLSEQYTQTGPLSYSQLYYDPSSANLDTLNTAGTQFINYKQGHAYQELQIRLSNLFFDANKYIEPTTKLIDQKNTSLLQEHEEYSNFFSCKTALCSFYKELFAKRKTLKQTAISLTENDSWLTKLNYAKAMYSYLNYQSSYPILTADQKNEVILFAKKSKNQYLQQEILKAFSQETESETQLLTVFYSNLAAKAEELAKEKTGDGLTGKWEKFNFYTKTYLNVYYWITFGATLRNEDFDELTFSGEVASFVGTRKRLLKKFETYMNQNIKQKDYSLITDFYNKTDSEQGMYNQQAVLDATFKKYVFLETELKNFAETESTSAVSDFLNKEQSESYNHALLYSSNKMDAITRIKLASLMLNISNTDSNYRNTIVYTNARNKLISLGVDLGPIKPAENSTAELIYAVLPPTKWISNLTYGTYKSMKNRLFEISDADLQTILSEQTNELANNPLRDYRSFGEKVDSFLVAAGDLKWWPVYALVEEVVPISAGISTVGKGFLRTTKVSTLNILGKSNYRVLVTWINRSIKSSSGLLKHQVNKLIYSQLGRAEYKVFKRQGPIYYFERLFAEKTVETFPGSAGVMRALTSTQPKSALNYLGKLAWGKASGKAFLDLPLEREVFRYSILAKFSPAITLSDDYARLAYEVAQDEGTLLPISSGKFNGEAGIINTGKSKVLVLKRNTGWISQGNNTYLELDIKNATFDTARGLYPAKPIAIDIGPTALDNKGLAQIIQAMETKNVTSEVMLSDTLNSVVAEAVAAKEIVILPNARAVALLPTAQPVAEIAEKITLGSTTAITGLSTTEIASKGIHPEEAGMIAQKLMQEADIQDYHFYFKNLADNSKAFASGNFFRGQGPEYNYWGLNNVEQKSFSQALDDTFHEYGHILSYRDKAKALTELESNPLFPELQQRIEAQWAKATKEGWKFAQNDPTWYSSKGEAFALLTNYALTPRDYEGLPYMFFEAFKPEDIELIRAYLPTSLPIRPTTQEAINFYLGGKLATERPIPLPRQDYLPTQPATADFDLDSLLEIKSITDPVCVQGCTVTAPLVPENSIAQTTKQGVLAEPLAEGVAVDMARIESLSFAVSPFSGTSKTNSPIILPQELTQYSEPAQAIDFVSASDFARIKGTAGICDAVACYNNFTGRISVQIDAPVFNWGGMLGQGEVDTSLVEQIIMHEKVHRGLVENQGLLWQDLIYRSDWGDLRKTFLNYYPQYSKLSDDRVAGEMVAYSMQLEVPSEAPNTFQIPEDTVAFIKQKITPIVSQNIKQSVLSSEAKFITKNGGATTQNLLQTNIFTSADTTPSSAWSTIKYSIANGQKRKIWFMNDTGTPNELGSTDKASRNIKINIAGHTSAEDAAKVGTEAYLKSTISHEVTHNVLYDLPATERAALFDSIESSLASGEGSLYALYYSFRGWEVGNPDYFMRSNSFEEVLEKYRRALSANGIASDYTPDQENMIIDEFIDLVRRNNGRSYGITLSDSAKQTVIDGAKERVGELRISKMTTQTPDGVQTYYLNTDTLFDELIPVLAENTYYPGRVLTTDITQKLINSLPEKAKTIITQGDTIAEQALQKAAATGKHPELSKLKITTPEKTLNFSCHSPCIWNPSERITVTNPECGSIAVLEDVTGLDGLKVSGEFGKGFIKGTELVEYSSQDVAQKGITAIVKGKVSLPNISTGGIATIESAMKQGKIIALISPDGQGAQKITVYLTSSNVQGIKNLVTNIPNSDSQPLYGTSTISQRKVAVQNALGIDYPTFENVKGWVLYDQGDDARRVRAIIEMDLRGVNEVVQYYTNPYGQIVVPPNPSAIDSFMRNYINGSITLQRLESKVFGPLETTGTNAATNYRASFNRFVESLNSSTAVPKPVQIEEISSPKEFQRIASSGLSTTSSAIQLAQNKGYYLEYKNGLKAFVAPRVRQFENTWAKGKTMENRALLLGVYDEYSDALYVERYIAPRGTLQFRSEWMGQTKEGYDAYVKLHSEIVDLIDTYVYTRTQESLNQIAQYLDFLNKHGLLVTDEPTAYLAKAYTSGDPNWYTYLDQVDVVGTSHIVNNTKAFQQYAASQIIQSEIVPNKKLYEVGTNHIHPSGATDPSFGDACAQAYLTQEGGIIKTIREKLGIIPKRPLTYSSISVDPTLARGQGYIPLIVGENTCVNVLGVWRSGAIRPEDFHPNEAIPIVATTYAQ